MRYICGYAAQSGGSLEEIQTFCDEQKGEKDMHSTGDLVMCLVDYNGLLGRHVNGFDGFMEGMS